MHIILGNLGHFVIHTIDLLGYTGIALLMAIESAAIPLPSEIIIPPAGFLVLSGKFTFWGIALSGAIGSTLGSCVIYFIGFYGGRPLLMKYGRYIFISHRDMETAEKFFNRYGLVALLIGRVIPIIRTYMSLPAGISKANLTVLAVTSFIGSFIWCMFLAWIGFKLGQNWSILEVYFRKFDYLIAIAIISFVALWIHRHIKQNTDTTLPD